MERFYTIKKGADFHLVCHDTRLPDPKPGSSDINKQTSEARKRMAFKIADFLMEQVYAFRWRDNYKALNYATAILNLGCGVKLKRIEALGFMAIGDTLSTNCCHLKTAWSLQQQGAELFKAEHDKLGWARTTIGRTGICIELNLVDETLAEAREALHYFLKNNYDDYYLRLCQSITKVYNQLGKYHETINLFNQAKTRGAKAAGLWTQHMGVLCNNTGIAYLYLGLYHEAKEYFELALSNFIQLNKPGAVIYVRENIAFIEQMLGNYRKALKQYHEISVEGLEFDSMYLYRIKLDLVDCYLALNQNEKAKNLAKNLLAIYSGKDLNNVYDLASTLRCLGYAEAKLGRLRSAENQLIRTEQMFVSLKATAWSNQIRLIRARILMRMHNYKKAQKLTKKAKAFFKAKEFFINLQEALLIEAGCYYKIGKYNEALKYCQDVLRAIETTTIPQLYYEANLLAGRIKEATRSYSEAEQYYYAAFQCLEKWQRDMTITIKTNFMEDKSLAFHKLMHLVLKKNDPGVIISLLERYRSSTLLGYMTNREQLYWSATDKITRDLLENLTQLREEHNLFFKMSYERHLVTDDSLLLDPDEARAILSSCEEEIRQLVEQLYLRSDYSSCLSPINIPSIKDIEEALPARAVLIAYYYYKNKIRVILIRQKTEHMITLETPVSSIKELLTRYYFNIQCQLSQKGKNTRQLVKIFKQISFCLYSALIQPWESFLNDVDLIYFVPFGLLSYIPFNTLSDGKDYLIDSYEIVMLPSISLLERKAPARGPGGTVIAYSKEGKYPGIQAEAGSIAEIFSCCQYAGHKATRDKLTGRGQILHIAAHGMHRPDQPDFSFIELADGQLFADDLIQLDLNYELITLSGCETGRLAVKQSEEMIGLIRGALLAGAGSLVVSLWHIDDQVTADLMLKFYTLLKQGKSRAYAIAVAQRSLKAGVDQLLPAYWGAFQLIGESSPLDLM